MILTKEQKQSSYEEFQNIPETEQTEQGTLTLSEIILKDNMYLSTYTENSSEGMSMTNSARIVVSYSKEVQVWFDEYSDVTEYYYYKEYSSEYKTWCSGYLQLKTVRAANGKYLATYNGVLQGTI